MERLKVSVGIPQRTPVLKVQLQRKLDQTWSNAGSSYSAKRSICDCRIRICKLGGIEGVEELRPKFDIGNFRGPPGHGSFDQGKVEVALIWSANDPDTAVT